MCLELCLGLQVDFIHQHDRFYDNSMLFHYYSSIVQFEVRDGAIFSSSFIIHNCFSYLVDLVFPYEAENYPFNFCDELCQNFDGDCTEFVDCVW